MNAVFIGSNGKNQRKCLWLLKVAHSLLLQKQKMVTSFRFLALSPRATNANGMKSKDYFYLFSMTKTVWLGTFFTLFTTTRIALLACLAFAASAYKKQQLEEFRLR